MGMWSIYSEPGERQPGGIAFQDNCKFIDCQTGGGAVPECGIIKATLTLLLYWFNFCLLLGYRDSVYLRPQAHPSKISLEKLV